MASRLRSLAPWIVLALVGAGLTAVSGLVGFFFSDYDTEAAPAYAVLVRGHVGHFFEFLPAYGGSLIMRAPFALAASALGGDELAVFRAVSVPCLLAGSALAIVLAASLAARGAGRGTIATVVGLCAANPITLRALDVGHPEELLGAALSVGAVLAALKGRSTLAGILLGLAVANKAWALLAIGPVLLALQADRRRALVIAGGIATAFMLPLLLTDTTGAPAAAAHTGVIFQPWQAWWFLGDTGHVIRGTSGLAKVGYRAAPEWLMPLTHPLIVFMAIPISLLAWRRRADPLLLLSLLFVVRCVIDPWNTAYYMLPAILAVVAWEATRVIERPPLLALSMTVAVWATWQWIVPIASPDAQSLLYLAWSLPLVGFLGWRLYAPALPAMPKLSSGGRASVWSTTQ
jgi:hypothetical protein